MRKRESCSSDRAVFTPSTEQLISAAIEAGFDLRTLPVILMGGGAATVMRNVSERDGLCRAFLLGDAKVERRGF